MFDIVADDGQGLLIISHPLMIDFSLDRYTVVATVNDGVNTSAPETITIKIPAKIKMCTLQNEQLTVAKQAAPALLHAGAAIGNCKRR